MSDPIEASVFRIYKRNGKIAGTGFLVTPTFAVTCAHVIEMCDSIVGDIVQIYFQHAQQTQTAQVHALFGEDDIAFLEVLAAGRPTVHLGFASNSGGKDLRAFGYPEGGNVEERWVTGKIGGLTHVSGFAHDLLQLDGEQIDRGLSGGPVWDQAIGLVVGMISGFDDLDPKRGFQGKGKTVPAVRLGYAITAETLRLLYPELKGSDLCPYRGLDAFTEADARFFHGRNRLIDQLAENLKREPRFLAVLGPSGSGKSSVINAGLVPELRNGAILGSETWNFFSVRPRRNPFHELEGSGLLESSSGISAALQSWISSSPNSYPVLVFDQFEELFTLTPQELQQQFLLQIAELLESDLPVTVMVILRDDFYSLFTRQSPILTRWLERGLANVPVMLSRNELWEIITAPSEQVGIQFEPGLVENIINDVTNGEHEGISTLLPLLEFALTQLWERREDGLLTHAGYQKLGGTTGGLASWADRTFHSIPIEQRELVRHILTSLVHLGDEQQHLPDTRRRLRMADLVPAGESEQNVKVTIKLLADARLLVTSGDEIEITHEILLRSWPQLRQWLKEDREVLRLREGVIDEARKWNEAGRDENLLNHRGARLELALALLQNSRYPLNATGQTYLAACVGQKEREIATAARRRRQAITGVSIALALILIILFGWGWTSNKISKQLEYQVDTAQAAQAIALEEVNQRSTAEIRALFGEQEAEKQRQLSLARQLAAQSIAAVEQHQDNELALLLAVEGLHVTDESGLVTYEIDQAIRKSLAAAPLATIRSAEDEFLGFPTFSLDGTKLAGAFDNDKIRIIDTSSGLPLAILGPEENMSYKLSFSLDARMLATSGKDGKVRLWDIKTGRIVRTFPHDEETDLQDIDFPLDGNSLITGSEGEDGKLLKYWDLLTGEKIAEFHEKFGESVFTTHNGTILQAELKDGAIQIIEPLTGKRRIEIHPIGNIREFTWGPNGNQLATIDVKKKI